MITCTEMLRHSGCTRRQLAMAYNPHITTRSARRALNVWIRRHPTLLTRLQNAGFTTQTRSLTPLQVSLIFDALGEPA